MTPFGRAVVATTLVALLAVGNVVAEYVSRHVAVGAWAAVVAALTFTVWSVFTLSRPHR